MISSKYLPTCENKASLEMSLLNSLTHDLIQKIPLEFMVEQAAMSLLTVRWAIKPTGNAFRPAFVISGIVR
jgi:hypothetical protein